MVSVTVRKQCCCQRLLLLQFTLFFSSFFFFFLGGGLGQFVEFLSIISTGYTGNFCEVNRDDCATTTCPATATCIDGINQAYCRCPVGKAAPTCIAGMSRSPVSSSCFLVAVQCWWGCWGLLSLFHQQGCIRMYSKYVTLTCAGVFPPYVLVSYRMLSSCVLVATECWTTSGVFTILCSCSYMILTSCWSVHYPLSL